MGNIDLNSIVFNANLNKEEILKHLTQEEIYKYYTGNKIEIPCTFCSPLRDDNVPSFGYITIEMVLELLCGTTMV